MLPVCAIILLIIFEVFKTIIGIDVGAANGGHPITSNERLLIVSFWGIFILIIIYSFTLSIRLFKMTRKVYVIAGIFLNIILLLYGLLMLLGALIGG